jgi:hypothetical protein
MSQLYKPDREALPIHQLSSQAMNCNDALIPKYIARYNPVHPKEKQTMICHHTPETVCLFQIGCTNHNFPYISPENPDLSLSINLLFLCSNYNKAGRVFFLSM